MRVLQVIPTLSAGGAEGFLVNLGVGLAKAGAEVSFYLMAGVRGERGRLLLSRLREENIRVTGEVEASSARSPANVVRLAKVIRFWRPDVVQANMYPAEVVVAMARILAMGAQTHYFRRLAGTEICGYRSEKIVRLMDRVFRHTIACSPAVSSAYRQFIGENRKSNIFTIPNGGLLKGAITTTEEKRQAREKLALPLGAFTIVHIGRMSAGAPGMGLESGQKAHDVLIGSFARAFAGSSDHVLVLVGDGPLRWKAEELAASLGVRKQTRFLGEQPEPWPALDAADLFFFPSRHEGLPNVLPEAASCGLPVVASDIDEIRSLAPGDAWLLKSVDEVDAFATGLKEVADNYQLFAGRAVKAAPEIRERFTMRLCAEKYLRLYETVVRRI